MGLNHRVEWMLQTRKCLDEINELYQSGPADMGPDLLDRVVDLYFVTVDQHTAEDTDAFGDVMTRMAFAGGGMARAKLAERMCREEIAPLELLRALACDDIITARPVLQFSPCLREGDLISILGQVDQDHMFATAQRVELPIPVTNLLMQLGTEMVLVAMARNTSARFSPEAKERLREVARSCADLHDALKLRCDMKRGHITRLKRLANPRFWQRMAVSLIMTEVQYAEAAAEQLLATDKQEPQVDPEIAEQPPEQEGNPYSDEMPGGIISENELESVAKAGDVEKTVEHFSTLVRLSQDMTRHCLFEAHITALLVLCKAHKLAQRTFTSLLLLREKHTGESTNDTVGLMRRYDGMTSETAQRVIRFSDKRQKADNAEKRKSDEPQALAS